jgi:uncharacterized CHY-type Zn-finger protein
MAASTTQRELVDLPNLEAVVRCEWKREAEATWHAFGVCPGCGTSRHAVVCDGCRKTLTSDKPTRCGECNFSGPGRKFFTRTFPL